MILSNNVAGNDEKVKKSSGRDALEFLANVSHEIRNPLNAVIGISRLLKNPVSEEEREKYIDGLLETSENLLALVNNIMDFSKLESGKLRFNPKPVDLSTTIHQSLASQKAIAEADGLHFEITIDPNLPSLVMIDSTKINQVIFNLVSNAIKFTREGSVTVALKVEEIRGSEASLRFTIKDTGIGIPEEKQNSVFDAFDQGGDDTYLKYGGTGLGLSISRSIIKALGGEIEVKSQLGKGSEFSFMLTVETKEDSLGNTWPVIETRDSKSFAPGLKVLVVDDNKLNVLVVQKNLEQWGIGFDIAYDGLSAVNKVQRQKFDLILMDLHMPEMDGLEAAGKIRKMYNRMPIIGLTASTEKFLQEKVDSAGFTDLLNKPFRPEELFDKIKAYTDSNSPLSKELAGEEVTPPLE